MVIACSTLNYGLISNDCNFIIIDVEKICRFFALVLDFITL